MYKHSLKKITPLLKSLAICCFIVALLFTGVGLFPATDKVVPAFTASTVEGRADNTDSTLLAKAKDFDPKELLLSHLPWLKDSTEPQPSLAWNPLNTFLFILTGVKIDEPGDFLKSEVPTMALIPLEIDSHDELEPDSISEPPNLSPEPKTPLTENNISSDVPLVALYCTHSSETYQLTEGITHASGKAGAVMNVAAAIADSIEKNYDIPTVFNDSIHDLSFNKSYVESQKTVQNLISDHPSLEMIFDIHRDSSLSRERTHIEINGKKCAKILIVVGTDSRASHPNWRKNHAFARKFAEKMDQLYPGLSRGISLKDGRYNQQHHPGALLLEVGSINNTREEALNSAELLAEVIVALLNDKEPGD